MNRRRMMMAQQANGFELVYDAASGLLPTESGWKIVKDTGNAAVNISNGVLEIRTTSDLHLTPNTEQAFSNCSIEINFIVGALSSVTLLLTKTEPTVYMTISSWYGTGVMVWQDWDKPLAVKEAISIGVEYTAKLEKNGNFVSAYLNGELIYSGEITGHLYTNMPDILGFNVASPTYVKKIKYKGY